jgi:hypothetical protein
MDKCEECISQKELLDRIVADDTAKDEVHCGCCVMLRLEVGRLRLALRHMKYVVVFFALLWAATLLSLIYFS